MSALIIIFLIVNIVVPLWIAYRACVSPQGVVFNHMLMFTIGYLFYWILPICVGISHLFSGELAMKLWYSVFNVIAPGTLVLYLMVTLCCYLAFAAGSALSARVRRPTQYRSTFFYNSLLNVPLILVLLAGAAYAFALRAQLFRGYTAWNAENGGVPERSSIVAVSVFLLALALVSMARRHELHNFKLSFFELMRSQFVVGYYVMALLVLSLGGRLYFVSGVVALLAYRTSYFRRVPSGVAVGVVAGVGILSAFLGVLRLQGTIDPGAAVLNAFIEPLFTGFSLIHFLGTATFEGLKFPVFLLSNFLNLIPTLLLPDKGALFVRPEDYGYVAFAPGGALNSYFSFMINFGILGTVAFFFGFAWFLSFLRKRDGRLLYRVTYVMLCGWIGFTFFRDDFSISLVKAMFQFSMLTPLVLVLAAQLASVALRSVARSAPESGEAVS